MTELATTLDRLFEKMPARNSLASIVATPEHVDDVLQELAERLLSKPAAPTSPKSYLKGAARNLALNWRRAEVRRKRYEADYGLLVADESVSLEQQIDAAKAVEALNAALMELPAITRTLFMQSYVLGESQSSVARSHGLHLSTVEKQLSKAKRHCLKRLAKYID